MDEYSRMEGHEDPPPRGTDIWVDEYSRLGTLDVDLEDDDDETTDT